ncbi:MAG: thiol peroxidase [Chlamydiae bacterium]|nr:thiol peroxidase [Chlamydiota bacterium]
MTKITFKGSMLTVVGRKLKVKTLAPNFKVTSQDLQEVSLIDFKDKIKVISSFPSLDTSVCDMQVKEFNKRALGLSNDVAILGISMDLPFAQKRFCDSFEVKNIKILSDYKSANFGINYGLLIQELHLLARGVIVLDKNNVIRYIQVAPELTHSLNFDEAIKSLQEVIKTPSLGLKEVFSFKCKPCEGGVKPLSKTEVIKLIPKGWELIDDKKIVKEFKFKNFNEAKFFLDLIATIAEEEGHHPNMCIMYNKLVITLTTHAAKGLTNNDLIMANIIEGLNHE